MERIGFRQKMQVECSYQTDTPFLFWEVMQILDMANKKNISHFCKKISIPE